MMNLKNFDSIQQIIRKTILLLFLNFIALFIYAQDSALVKQSRIEVDFSVDFVSSYVWRGLQFSEGINIQPVVSLKMDGFEFGVWGSGNFTANYNEIDLFSSYTFKGFTFGVVDYFFTGNQSINASNNYFDYSANTTNHYIELSAGYENPGKYPFRLLVATFVYGADRDANNNNYFSSYIEFGYKLNMKHINFDFFIGGVVNDNFIYLNDKGIINLGFKAEKEIKINDKFSLPVQLSLITNPVRQNVFFVFVITI